MASTSNVTTSYVSKTEALESAKKQGLKTQDSNNSTLDMTDFLYLMVQQFQNQTMDNTASTSDMMNQLVQMSVVQAVTNITDATTLMYAGSLVGKEVTLGEMNSEGKYEEIVGTVTGTGTYGGKQVIFVNGKTYSLSEIMAIGRVPEVEEPDAGDKPEDGKPGDEKPDNTLPPTTDKTE